jgi:hypothetical protein
MSERVEMAQTRATKERRGEKDFGTYLKSGCLFRAVIPAIPKAFGRSGILLKIKKDSGQAGMT